MSASGVGGKRMCNDNQRGGGGVGKIGTKPLYEYYEINQWQDV